MIAISLLKNLIYVYIYIYRVLCVSWSNMVMTNDDTTYFGHYTVQ